MTKINKAEAATLYDHAETILDIVEEIEIKEVRTQDQLDTLTNIAYRLMDYCRHQKIDDVPSDSTDYRLAKKRSAKPRKTKKDVEREKAEKELAQVRKEAKKVHPSKRHDGRLLSLAPVKDSLDDGQITTITGTYRHRPRSATFKFHKMGTDHVSILHRDEWYIVQVWKHDAKWYETLELNDKMTS